MTGIIILCRYNSSRLPGKILKKINGKEILQYILERLDILSQKYPVVVCTSIEDTDNPIADFCTTKNIQLFRGDLFNVSNRFLKCAKTYNFKNAVRINGDNLFLDSGIIQKMIIEIEKDDVKFISNVKGRTFPKGMSVEIVDISYYEQNSPKFQIDDLEHVMTYFYRLNNNEEHRFIYNEKSIPETVNLAIDNQDDFDNAQRIINLMRENHVKYGFEEIIKLYNSLKKNE